MLTVDSLPGLHEADLRQSRVEITNDFHARMLSGAMVTAAQSGVGVRADRQLRLRSRRHFVR